MNYLVTGTDTGVGKTFVTCGLIQAGRALGKQCVGMKPFCTGDLEDVAKIAAANGYLLPQHRVNPIWFRAPLAPYAAAMVENRMVDVQGVKETYSVLAKEFESVVVEGAGRKRGLPLKAVILNHVDDSESLAQQTNPGMLTHLLSAPPICLAYGQTDFGEVIRALGWV